jgi:transcriptional regulator with XRE-family HTH domain
MRNLNNEIAIQLKQIRKEKNITQVQLAEKLNVTQQSIQAIESGNININLSTLHKICEALNTRITVTIP